MGIDVITIIHSFLSQSGVNGNGRRKRAKHVAVEEIESTALVSLDFGIQTQYYQPLVSHDDETVTRNCDKKPCDIQKMFV